MMTRAEADTLNAALETRDDTDGCYIRLSGDPEWHGPYSSAYIARCAMRQVFDVDFTYTTR